jgi:hypothetical protein
MSGKVSQVQNKYAERPICDCQRHVMTLQKHPTARQREKPEIVYNTLTGL